MAAMDDLAEGQISRANEFIREALYEYTGGLRTGAAVADRNDLDDQRED